MSATLYSTATEYIANTLTISRGAVSDITSVGIFVNTSPNTIPAVSQFTTVQLVDGTITPKPPLAVAGQVDVVTKIGPGGSGVSPGDLASLAAGSYQVWILVRTASENIIRKVDTLTIT
jgi:hypothetical protein